MVAYENGVLRGIFVHKSEKGRGGWTKIRDEELHGLFSSPNVVRVIKPGMKWAEHVTSMDDKRYAYKVLVGKP